MASEGQEALPGSAGRRPAGADSPGPHKGWYSRHYLPHFDAAGTLYAITYRLADALPAEVVERLERRREADEAGHRVRVEVHLDKGYGACWLRQPAVADLVMENWFHPHQRAYEMHAWVIMPNHVHVLIRLLEGHSLAEVVRSWKSFSAREANRRLAREGAFWQGDYWDRYIRDERHYRTAIN